MPHLTLATEKDCSIDSSSTLLFLCLGSSSNHRVGQSVKAQKASPLSSLLIFQTPKLDQSSESWDLSSMITADGEFSCGYLQASWEGTEGFLWVDLSFVSRGINHIQPAIERPKSFVSFCIFCRCSPRQTAARSHSGCSCNDNFLWSQKFQQSSPYNRAFPACSI